MSSVFILFAGAWLLLSTGFYGLVVTRNLLKIVIALQIMVKGAAVMLVVAGDLSGQMALGQSLAITVIVADTMALVIGLALAVQVKARTGTLNIDEIIHLEG